MAAEGPATAEPARPPALASPDPVAPEIASLLRALPVAAVAGPRASRDASLALSFGRSLRLELRAGPEGIDLVLRPDARLSMAAAAELPGIVAALAARGITVSRAEIRGRTPAARRGRAR